LAKREFILIGDTLLRSRVLKTVGYLKQHFIKTWITFPAKTFEYILNVFMNGIIKPKTQMGLTNKPKRNKT